jgi:hypothetical protein
MRKLVLAGLVLASCHKDNKGARDSAECGVAVRVVSASDDVVALEFENVSDQTVTVGGSSDAAFVDERGMAMHAQMRPSVENNWFMPLQLPSKSRKGVTVKLTGGDASALDRIEVPNSGASRIPMCTIKASGLASKRR